MAEPVTREDGFYWVKVSVDWVVAEWYFDAWMLPGLEEDFADSDLDEIRERVIRS